LLFFPPPPPCSSTAKRLLSKKIRENGSRFTRLESNSEIQLDPSQHYSLASMIVYEDKSSPHFYNFTCTSVGAATSWTKINDSIVKPAEFSKIEDLFKHLDESVSLPIILAENVCATIM